MTHDPNFLPDDLHQRMLKAGFPENGMIAYSIPDPTGQQTERIYYNGITWTAAGIWIDNNYSSLIDLPCRGELFKSWHSTIDHALKLIEEKQ